MKKRLLTGDTPTGKLHLGHWVGSLEARVKLQSEYDCYFIIANMHAFTTRADKPEDIRQSVIDIVLDYLSAGIDPDQSAIFIQSEIPAIADLTFLFSMLLPFARVMRNPTIKDEIRDKDLGEHYSFGFPLYSVGQVADILTFRPELVPVGEDQLPHLEMTREVARRFNQLYCGIDSQTPDEKQMAEGGLFPIIQAHLSKTPKLVGTGAPNAEGHLLKMSKSLNNTIMLSDSADTVSKKIMSMYTDPNRLRPTDKGKTENNPLWIFHDIFNTDRAWVEQAKERYRQGQIGDVECKRKLIEVVNALLEPMRERRAQYEGHLDYLFQVLKTGTEKANTIADATLLMVKEKIKQHYF